MFFRPILHMWKLKLGEVGVLSKVSPLVVGSGGGLWWAPCRVCAWPQGLRFKGMLRFWCALPDQPPQPRSPLLSLWQLYQIQPLHHQQMWVVDMACLHNMNLVAIASTDQKIGESPQLFRTAPSPWRPCTCMWRGLSPSQL